MTNETRLQDLTTTLNSAEVTMTRLSDGSGVLVNLAGLDVIIANETGMLIVDALRAGAASVSDISTGLVQAFEVDQESATADTDAFIAKLQRALGQTAP